jgi:hypothetical protein
VARSCKPNCRTCRWFHTSVLAEFRRIVDVSYSIPELHELDFVEACYR